jgi:hypothetical protein
MSYKLILKEELDMEVSQAFAYYEGQQNKLGHKFLQSFEDALHSLEKHPLTYQIKFRNFRQINVTPFPYVLHFEVSDNKLIVFQLFHCRKNPKKRVKK